MSKTAKQLVHRESKDITSDSGFHTLIEFTPPNDNSSCYVGVVTVYGKDSEGAYYTGCWDLDIMAVKDGTTIEFNPADITFLSDTVSFDVNTLKIESDGAGNLLIKFKGEIALSPKNRTGSDTEYFKSQYRVASAVDLDYEPHHIGKKSSNGNIGHIWFSPDGTRNTEEIAAESVLDQNQSVALEADSNGDLHAIWATSTEIRYAKKSGGTWSTPETVSTKFKSITNLGLTVDVDSKNVPYVVWNNSNVDVIYLADRLGGSWSEESSSIQTAQQPRTGIGLHVESSSLIGVSFESGSNNVAIAIRDSGTWSKSTLNTNSVYRTTQITYNGTDWGISWIDGTSKNLQFASGNPTDGFQTEVVDNSRSYRSDYRTAAVKWSDSDNQWVLSAFENENSDNPGKIAMWTGSIGNWTERIIGAFVNDLDGTGSDEANLVRSDKGFVSAYVDVGQYGGSEQFNLAKSSDQGVTYNVVAEFQAVAP